MGRIVRFSCGGLFFLICSISYGMERENAGGLNLPPEIIKHLVSFCDVRSLAQLHQTCRYLYYARSSVPIIFDFSGRFDIHEVDHNLYRPKNIEKRITDFFGKLYQKLDQIVQNERLAKNNIHLNFSHVNLNSSIGEFTAFLKKSVNNPDLATKIELLDLSENTLMTVMKDIGEFTNLKILNKRKSLIEKLEFEAICGLPNLEELYLREVVFNKDFRLRIPNMLKNLPKLRKLDLRESSLSREVKMKIQQALPHVEILFSEHDMCVIS